MIQKSMVRKPYWRKSHTKVKLFDLAKVVQRQRKVAILTTGDYFVCL
jgi:hypothetical protein